MRLLREDNLPGFATRPFDAGFDHVDWQAEVAAALDDRHLVAWSDRADDRARFAASLQDFLSGQRGTSVLPLYGGLIDGLETFCHQLERSLPVRRLDRAVDGLHGVTAALRLREDQGPGLLARTRYIVWHDADHLLEADPDLFGHLVDALAGVAAEAEFASEDLLLIQRVLLLGGPSLARYARDESGQLRSWRRDGQQTPFWQSITGLERPQFRIETVERLRSGEPLLIDDLDLIRA
ncbi:MAG: hypothetical protein AAFR38_12640 [Planctomycetota bacterium]